MLNDRITFGYFNTNSSSSIEDNNGSSSIYSPAIIYRNLWDSTNSNSTSNSNNNSSLIPTTALFISSINCILVVFQDNDSNSNSNSNTNSIIQALNPSQKRKNNYQVIDNKNTIRFQNNIHITSIHTTDGINNNSYNNINEIIVLATFTRNSYSNSNTNNSNSSSKGERESGIVLLGLNITRDKQRNSKYTTIQLEWDILTTYLLPQVSNTIYPSIHLSYLVAFHPSVVWCFLIFISYLSIYSSIHLSM